jgi:Spy/CpxP family protein refolding chaperone
MVASAGLALAVGIAFAQTDAASAPPMHQGRRGHMMGGGPEFGMYLHQLNLTDEQKTQVKQIFQNEKPTLQPLRQKEGQLHLQLMQLIANDKTDQSQLNSLVLQETQVHQQMVLEHAKIGSQIYQLLSSDQKAKVGDMISKHQQLMQQRLQNGQGAAAEQQ